jgi:hypothetical protein
MTLRPHAAGAAAALISIAIALPLMRPALAAAPEPPISSIPVVFKTPWPALVALADSAIPKCTGTPPVCQDQNAANYIVRHEDDWFVVATILRREIGWKGSVWRFEPLQLSLQDATLYSSLNVFFRSKLSFLPNGATAACGYDEPPPSVRLGGKARIAFAPEWYLDLKVHPILEPDVRCDAVFERVDLAKWTAPLIDHAMDPVTKTVRDLVRAKTNLRDHAVPIWAKLQEPISIGPNLWLDVRPYAAFANVPEITDNGEYLTMKVGLDARPHVVLGTRPARGTRALPPLTGHEHGPAFNLNVRAVLDYNKMTRLLRQKLVGQTFAAGESWPARRFRVTVADASVKRNGQRVEVSVRVQGIVRGTLHLVGTPVFRDRGRLQGEIVIRNLDYTIQTRSLLVRLGNRLFQRRILERMRAAAVWDVSSELTQAYHQVNAALNQQLTPEARLQSTLSTFRPGRIWVTARGVEAEHRVGGQVTVVVTPF